MDINSLKSFLAVAQTQSFSKAAELLCITQPAVSKRIANLEAQLNAQLFDRIGHSVALTQAGKVLAPKAQDIISRLENCIQEIKNLNQTISGTLKIGLSHYIGLERIPPMLNAFAKAHPHVELDIQFYDSETAQQDILDGTIDIAIVTLPSTLAEINSPKHLNQIVIWQDILHLVTHSNHPLTKKSNIKISDIAQYPAILPDLNTFTGKLVNNYFKQAQLALDTRHPTNNLENIKVMIATGFMPNCWSVLPDRMIKDKNIKALAKDTIGLVRQLGCLTSSQRSLSNAAQEFINHLKTHKD